MRLSSPIRHVLGLFMVVALLLGSLGSALAQTPEASPAAEGSLGEGVIVFDNNGDELAQIAVNQVLDPYEGADGAGRGNHWVGVQFTVSVTGEDDYELNTYRLGLVDEQGFNFSSNYVSREEDVRATEPDLEIFEPIPAGDTVSGWLFYEVFNDSVLSKVVYSEVYGEGRFLVIGNLTGDAIGEGDATIVYDEQVNEISEITVDEIIPAFEDTEDDIDVDRGSTITAVNLTFDVTGDDAYEPDSYSVFAVDELGAVYNQTSVFRSEEAETDAPSLSSDAVDSGDSTTGLVFFEMPSDATLTYVIYSPEIEQIYVIAQPGDGSATSGEILDPVAPVVTEETPTDDGGDATEEAPVAEETGDCVGVAQWVEDVNEGVGVLDDSFAFLDDPDQATPENVRAAADQIDAVIEDANNIDVPEIAQDAHDSLITFLEAAQDAFNDIADRLEDGDELEDIQADLGAEDSEFTEAITNVFPTIEELTTACPDSNVEDLNL